jgi:hypothetical protein
MAAATKETNTTYKTHAMKDFLHDYIDVGRQSQEYIVTKIQRFRQPLSEIHISGGNTGKLQQAAPSLHKYQGIERSSQPGREVAAFYNKEVEDPFVSEGGTLEITHSLAENHGATEIEVPKFLRCPLRIEACNSASG